MATNREYQIEIDKSDFETFTFIYADDQEEPIDLTDYTAEMVIYWRDPAISARTVKIELDAVIATPANGSMTFELSSTQTATIPLGGARYGVRVINGSNEPTTIMTGPVRVYDNGF